MNALMMLFGMLFSLVAPAAAPPAAIPHGAGVAVGWDCCTTADLDRLGPVWYYDYRAGEGLQAAGHPRVELAWSSVPPSHLALLAQQYPGRAWILGNEPNDPDHVQDVQTPSSYVAIARAQAAAIRQADPSAAILSAGLVEGSTWWAQAIVDAGGGDLFDGWVIHSYNFNGDPYDPAVMETRVSRFRSWMDLHGYRNTPLILGEWGVWPHQGCARYPTDPDRCAAAYLMTTTRWLQQQRGVTAWAWFSLRADGRWAGDMLTPYGTLTPVGQAYHATFNPLDGVSP